MGDGNDIDGPRTGARCATCWADGERRPRSARTPTAASRHFIEATRAMTRSTPVTSARQFLVNDLQVGGRVFDPSIVGSTTLYGGDGSDQPRQRQRPRLRRPATGSSCPLRLAERRGGRRLLRGRGPGHRRDFHGVRRTTMQWAAAATATRSISAKARTSRSTFGGDGTGDAYAGGPGIDEIGFEEHVGGGADPRRPRQRPSSTTSG